MTRKLFWSIFVFCETTGELAASLTWHDFKGRAIYLDANIVIYAIEAGNRWFDLLRELFAAIDERATQAVTSELALAEVLGKPYEVGASELVAIYESVLRADGVIQVVPVDRTILRAAAQLQAKLGLKLMDAIHLATAKQRPCDFLLTNDDRFQRRIGQDIACIDLHAFAERRPTL